MVKKWWQATTNTSTGKPIVGKANVRSTDVPTGVMVTGAISASSVMPTIVLMHAEAACETNDLDEAKRKLEMVRARARNGQSVLPEIKTTDKDELREKIRHERRIELALEFERYFDLVRWGIAEDKVANFVVGKHEVFPLPQTEIDKSNGKLQQNPKY